LAIWLHIFLHWQLHWRRWRNKSEFRKVTEARVELPATGGNSHWFGGKLSEDWNLGLNKMGNSSYSLFFFSINKCDLLACCVDDSCWYRDLYGYLFFNQIN
jgi:hypothetical protein